MIEIALYEPEIPPNTGNIIRLSANIGATLHLIHPMGFEVTDKQMRRAGLDYISMTRIIQHPSATAFLEAAGNKRLLACSTRGKARHDEIDYDANDILLFGPETRGLPQELLDQLPENQRIRIPMRPNNRSLNLANSVAIIAYEAWRQLGFDGAV